MLFGRRVPAGFGERVRITLWPRRSFWRSAKYFAKRALRLSATPHAIASGVAAGVFVSFLPIPGLHIVIAALFAWMLAGNIVASAIGTAFGNPITFPVIWGACYELGELILNGSVVGPAQPIHLGHALAHLDFAPLWEPLLKPITVGAIPLGLFFAVVFYVLTRWAATAFRDRRRHRLAARARAGAESSEPAPSS